MVKLDTFCSELLIYQQVYKRVSKNMLLWYKKILKVSKNIDKQKNK